MMPLKKICLAHRLARFFAMIVGFGIAYLNALELNISYGKEKNQTFSIITLQSSQAFLCETIYQDGGSYMFVRCNIPKIPENGFLPFNTDFFNVSYEMQDGSFVLFIHPTKKIKLFYIPDNLPQTYFFSDAKEEKSKIWQIVGFNEEIPFLSPETNKQGINFPIRMDPQKLDYIGEMNIDKNPLKSTTGADYADYLAVKNLIEHHNYKFALSAISQAFKKFPNTFFAKDLLFFQIKALYNLELYDNVIENANAWIKAYSSDDDIPEMLYMLGNTYGNIHFPTEANYYYQRIIQQYPKSRFTPLAKMRLAKVFMNDSNMGMARIYFSQAYEGAKDLDSVTEIALEWAFFELQTHNPENAKELIKKILEKNPAYFTVHPQKTKIAIAYLSDKKLYDSAAAIGQYYFDHTNEYDNLHEPIGFMLGDLYAKAGDFDAAHKSNQAYIKEYESLPRAKEIEKQDDKLLFNVSGDDKTKLARYDYILDKYPNTAESKEAAKLKAELLLKLERYSEVLDMGDVLRGMPKLYDDALLGVINQNIAQNRCDDTNRYLVDLNDFSRIKHPKKAFECLYDAKLYAKANDLTNAQVKDPNNPDYLFWLYNHARVLNALDKYADSTIASNDVLSLSKAKKTTRYDDVLFTLFDNLTHTDKRGAKELYGRLESGFRDDVRMLKVYAWLLGDEKLDATTRAIYAKNLLDLQNVYQNSDYTPFADFKLIDAYQDLAKKEQALEVADALSKKELKAQDMQKALYLKASLEIALKKDAKETLKRCNAIKEESSWRTLCVQSEGLLMPQNQEDKTSQDQKTKE